VDQFDGNGHGQGRLGRAAHRFGGGHRQYRPKAFAAGKEQVAHGTMERDRRLLDAGEKLLEGGVDQADAVAHVLASVHR
jgi:hypothetical protein